MKEKKEIIKVPIEVLQEWHLYRVGDIATYEGEGYSFVTSHHIDGDGEWTRVVVKRESDDKLFAYDWGYGDTKNFYEPNLFEVNIKTKNFYE